MEIADREILYGIGKSGAHTSAGYRGRRPGSVRCGPLGGCLHHSRADKVKGRGSFETDSGFNRFEVPLGLGFSIAGF